MVPVRSRSPAPPKTAGQRLFRGPAVTPGDLHTPRLPLLSPQLALGEPMSEPSAARQGCQGGCQLGPVDVVPPGQDVGTSDVSSSRRPGSAGPGRRGPPRSGGSASQQDLQRVTQRRGRSGEVARQLHQPSGLGTAPGQPPAQGLVAELGPSSLPSRKASTMRRSMVSTPSEISSVSGKGSRPRSKVSGTNWCQLIGSARAGRRVPRGSARSYVAGTSSISPCRASAERRHNVARGARVAAASSVRSGTAASSVRSGAAASVREYSPRPRRSISPASRSAYRDHDGVPSLCRGSPLPSSVR